MRIWVDADVTPREARHIVRRAAERMGVDASVVAGRDLPTPPAAGNDGVPSTVHAYILAQMDESDVVITRDAKLAREFAAAGAVAIDIRGREYSASTAHEAKSVQKLLADIRTLRAGDRGPPAYDDRAKREFAGTVDRVLWRLVGGDGARRPDWSDG